MPSCAASSSDGAAADESRCRSSRASTSRLGIVVRPSPPRPPLVNRRQGRRLIQRPPNRFRRQGSVPAPRRTCVCVPSIKWLRISPPGFSDTEISRGGFCRMVPSPDRPASRLRSRKFTPPYGRCAGGPQFVGPGRPPASLQVGPGVTAPIALRTQGAALYDAYDGSGPPQSPSGRVGRCRQPLVGRRLSPPPRMCFSCSAATASCFAISIMATMRADTRTRVGGTRAHKLAQTPHAA